MPAGDTKGSNPGQRTTFRPPWVKGPDPLPVPSEPWNLKNAKKRDSTSSSDDSESSSSTYASPIAGVQLKRVKTKETMPENGADTQEKENPIGNVQLKKVKKKDPQDRESFRKEKENNPLAGVQLRKTSVKTKEPQENGQEKENFFKKPQLKPVPQKEKSPPRKDYKIPDLPKLSSVNDRKLPERKPSFRKLEDDDEDDLEKELPAKRNSLVRDMSVRRLSNNAPKAPPMPPPPPCMPGMESKNQLSDEQRQKLELLKSRPKQRPDWSGLLKDIEGGRKLNHVQCNDRSQPLLPEVKAQEHFVFESENKNTPHHELLKQIEGGVKLKRVKTNDRSKPMLDGLRKFRRQMTIEEQIQKSISMASIPPEEIITDEADEMDDIDKVRDDLQSTKQMLALELRNKEAVEMENRRLLHRIANLEAELDKEKASKGDGKESAASNSADEKVVQNLKKQAEETRKHSEQLEKKYTEAAKELDTAKLQLDETKRKNAELEKKLQEALSDSSVLTFKSTASKLQQPNYYNSITSNASFGKRVSLSGRKDSTAKDEEEEPEEEDSSEDSDGEDTEEKQLKRLQKEVKQLANKLRNFKNKEDNAKKERIALKEIIKKNQAAIKDEKKKYNRLKKEVDKMAALMKDEGSDEEEDEDDEEEKAEEEEVEEESEEESSEESETEDESDSEKSQSEPEDAPAEKKKVNLQTRSKRHENRLGALKKGNFLLKTNAENLQDELNKQKELTAALQEDLDSVLSELG